MTETQTKRQHKATFARDKRMGGWLIRVEGPHSNRFARREVPVTRKDGTETRATLEDVIWTGKDEESGKPVSLYGFTPDPQQQSDFEF